MDAISSDPIEMMQFIRGERLAPDVHLVERKTDPVVNEQMPANISRPKGTGNY